MNAQAQLAVADECVVRKERGITNAYRGVLCSNLLHASYCDGEGRPAMPDIVLQSGRRARQREGISRLRLRRTERGAAAIESSSIWKDMP
jgi:hypothetical protein